MHKSVPFDDFYCAVGKASTAWMALEDAILDVFARSVLYSVGDGLSNRKPHAMFVLGNIFYASTNFRGRLKMIADVLNRIVTEETITSEWNAVSNRLLKLYKRRNVLAHGGVWGNGAGASCIMGSLFDTGRKQLTYVQVCACERSFRDMSKRLQLLAVSIGSHLAPGGPFASRQHPAN
jgi:hypothetical protein